MIDVTTKKNRMTIERMWVRMKFKIMTFVTNSYILYFREKMFTLKLTSYKIRKNYSLILLKQQIVNDVHHLWQKL
jgi:hypothetical protein